MLYTNKRTNIVSNRFGGKGDVIIKHYIDEEMINDTIVMYAEVILKPGCSLGYHQHSGNSETIVVLKGTADYCDNGTTMTLKPGDTVHCPDGDWHSIGNNVNATEDLHLQALIAKSK